MIVVLLVAMLVCAFVPALLFCINLRRYVPPPPTAAPTPSRPPPTVSILIPARNEAPGIADAVRCALASQDVDVEVVVMDDGSTDGTDLVVLALARDDARVRLERAPPLPPGWNGKQHACWALAHAARSPLLCFVDADVRLGPDCIARMAAFLDQSRDGSGSNRTSLVSGFPQQLTGTALEWLLLPLIHFVLLGFLPLGKMREGTDPAFAAGCGQFMLVCASDYFACGGHSGIRLTMHDGLRLPRLFRQHGLRADLADLTPLATCRMYRTAAEVWSGLAKNATEGIASPGRIVPISLTLFLGQIMPSLMLLLLLGETIVYAPQLYHHAYIFQTHPVFWVLATCWTLAVFFAWLPRILAVRRFRQDWRSALLHPLGILLLLAIQWYALFRQLRGSPVTWKSRAYTEK